MHTCTQIHVADKHQRNPKGQSETGNIGYTRRSKPRQEHNTMRVLESTMNKTQDEDQQNKQKTQPTIVLDTTTRKQTQKT